MVNTNTWGLCVEVKQSMFYATPCFRNYIYLMFSLFIWKLLGNYSPNSLASSLYFQFLVMSVSGETDEFKSRKPLWTHPNSKVVFLLNFISIHHSSYSHNSKIYIESKTLVHNFNVKSSLNYWIWLRLNYFQYIFTLQIQSTLPPRPSLSIDPTDRKQLVSFPHF